MTKTVHPRPHSLIAKTFHWGFLGLFAYGISKGLDNVNQLADTALLRFEMWFASFFLVVLAARFFFMRTTRPTALPETTSRGVHFVARSAHLAIYISLAMIAMTGLSIGGLYSLGVTGGALMAFVIGLHEVAIGASFGLIGLHILAALYHRFKRDGIWSAMVPVWKE